MLWLVTEWPQRLMLPALILSWSCWFGNLWKLSREGTSGGSRPTGCALESCTNFQVLVLLWGSALLRTPDVLPSTRLSKQDLKPSGSESEQTLALKVVFISHFVTTIRKLNQVTVVRSLSYWELPARWPPRQPSYFNPPPPSLWVAFDYSNRKHGCWPQDSCSRRLHSSMSILDILYGSRETSLLR